jgi:ATP-dependent DNA ligase
MTASASLPARTVRECGSTADRVTTSPTFNLIRYRRHDDDSTFLYAFDLIELDGEDLRHEPIERRKAALAKLIRRARTGLVLNEPRATAPAARGTGSRAKIRRPQR